MKIEIGDLVSPITTALLIDVLRAEDVFIVVGIREDGSLSLDRILDKEYSKLTNENFSQYNWYYGRYLTLPVVQCILVQKNYHRLINHNLKRIKHG